MMFGVIFPFSVRPNTRGRFWLERRSEESTDGRGTARARSVRALYTAHENAL